MAGKATKKDAEILVAHQIFPAHILGRQTLLSSKFSLPAGSDAQKKACNGCQLIHWSRQVLSIHEDNCCHWPSMVSFHIVTWLWLSETAKMPPETLQLTLHTGAYPTRMPCQCVQQMLCNFAS